VTRASRLTTGFGFGADRATGPPPGIRSFCPGAMTLVSVSPLTRAIAVASTL
jgi:hypothetical protein